MMMSRRREGGVGGRRIILEVNRSNNDKEAGADEDLLLFREMHKREKDAHLSLLQPISVEFEANGSNAVYRVGSGKRSSGTAGGLEFLAENGKNDYDWLKTPPATPLFPSLEMEAAAAGAEVQQREIPVIQPLSRFADKNSSSETTVRIRSSTHQRPKSSKPKHPPVMRYDQTPTRKQPTTSSSSDRHMKNIIKSSSSTGGGAVTAVLRNLKKMNLSGADDDDGIINNEILPASSGRRIQQKESHPCCNNYPTASKSARVVVDSSSSSTTKPTSRGVSPLVRSKIITSTQIPAGFDSDSTTPPPNNLKTDRRSLSATRGRWSGGDQNRLFVGQKQLEAAGGMKAIRRQSCSPRRRKLMETTTTDHFQANNNNNTAVDQRAGRVQQINNNRSSSSSYSAAAAQIAGSRMVDKLLNARNMSSGSDHLQERKTSTNESSGLGRAMSKTSLDMALKHMDFRRYRVNMQPITYPRH